MGTFVISLDFELHWGVRDHRTVADYRENLLGVRRVVPALLALFSEYGIRATWATVGFLFFESNDELMAALPSERPAYVDKRFDPYAALGEVGKNEADDPFHFAPTLIRMIQAAPQQEIATHTFSHFYAMADGPESGIVPRGHSRGVVCRPAFWSRDQEHRVSAQSGDDRSRADLCRGRVDCVSRRGVGSVGGSRQRSRGSRETVGRQLCGSGGAVLWRCKRNGWPRNRKRSAVAISASVRSATGGI